MARPRAPGLPSGRAKGLEVTDGVERHIDFAEVNGRTFLNNVSLGIYGDTVRSPAYRDAKVRTLLETAVEVMRPGAEAPALRLDDPG